MKTHVVLFCCVLAKVVLADGSADNLTTQVRRVPPPGIAISAADRVELEQSAAKLRNEIESLRTALKTKPTLLSLLPDVEIFYNAVHYPLTYDEFYKTNEPATARALLAQGLERATQLRFGHAPWTTNTGLIVRGYQSKIDGSIQPFSLVVPPTYNSNSAHQHRLDLWFHGRGETMTELDFLQGSQKNPAEFAPPDTFVLRLYGRYCNANKFAGEIDAFEAMDAVKKEYPIDENRIAVRGFSMGGAACWHFAVHYAGLWAAAAPGAGFAETPEFLKVFQKEIINPAPYEKKLLHWYDATDYALNLFNCPTVAYSGEIDIQKEAADIMAQALTAEGLQLTHIIGPNTAHKYEPEAKKEVARRIDAIVEKGRDPIPKEIRFTTYTLRYNQMLWLTVDGLEEHWQRSTAYAQILDPHSLKLTTTNITALTLSMPSGQCPLINPIQVTLDNQTLPAPPVQTDRSWSARFTREQGTWRVTSTINNNLRKAHGLQGPIDDAFMDSFIMVTPTGKPMNDKTAQWVSTEQTHAIDHWRRQFRGEARVKTAQQITPEDIASSNLILWGDPASNQLLEKILPQLPLHWTPQQIEFRDKKYSSAENIPVLIYPNPLNPKHYIVLNSGFTFREYDYLNNARQIPKLPDYAIINLSAPPDAKTPGKIMDAGFFDERWK